MKQLKNRKALYFILILGQLFYSLFGSEFFPFSRFDTFAKYKKINRQEFFRVLSSPDSKEYVPEGIQREIDTSIKYLLKYRGLKATSLENYFPFSIYAVDVFTIDKYRDGKFVKMKRGYTRDNVL